MSGYRNQVGLIDWLPGMITKPKKPPIIALHPSRKIHGGILYFTSRLPLTAEEIALRMGLPTAQIRVEIASLVRLNQVIVTQTFPRTYRRYGPGRKTHQIRLYRAA